MYLNETESSNSFLPAQNETYSYVETDELGITSSRNPLPSALIFSLAFVATPVPAILV